MTLRLSPHTLAMDSGRVQMCSATAPVSQDGRTVSVRWWPKPDRVLPCALTRARRNLATLCSQPSPSKCRSRQCGQATAPKHINIATLCATVHRARAEQKNTHLIYACLRPTMVVRGCILFVFPARCFAIATRIGLFICHMKGIHSPPPSTSGLMLLPLTLP